MQCDHCAGIARLLVRKGIAVDVAVRGLDFQVPKGLPPELQKLLNQAVACFDAGSPAATVVLAGLFIEGLLTKEGLQGNRLVDMIDAAHKSEPDFCSRLPRSNSIQANTKYWCALLRRIG
jgi:hypothetical protein